MHHSRAVVKTRKTKFSKRKEEVDENLNDIPEDDFEDDYDLKAIRSSKDILDKEEDPYEQ